MTHTHTRTTSADSISSMSHPQDTILPLCVSGGPFFPHAFLVRFWLVLVGLLIGVLVGFWCGSLWASGGLQVSMMRALCSAPQTIIFGLDDF